jgi:uncharacterized protein YqfA (UPF0365 family)
LVTIARTYRDPLALVIPMTRVDKDTTASPLLEESEFDAHKAGGIEIDTAIDAVLANQKALWDLEASRIAALRTVLSSKQMARMVFTLPTMGNQIAKRMRAVNSVDAEGRAAGGEIDGKGPKQRPARRDQK